MGLNQQYYNNTSEQILAINDLNGLCPSSWLCIGGGFSREEIKALLLSQGKGFVGDAITTIREIALKILQADAETCLGPLARQEVLRVLFTDARITKYMPELRRLKRQLNFFRRLDRSLQAGRMTFSHWEEEDVLAKRCLSLQLGNVSQKEQLRSELRLLTHAYEAWLEANKLWDPPLAIRTATTILRERWPCIPSRIRWPKNVYLLSNQEPESLEQGFLNALSDSFTSGINLHRLGSAGAPTNQSTPQWKLWHTLDDAAEELASELAATFVSDPMALGNSVILIPDESFVRRSLLRVLRERGIPLADLRNPELLKVDEKIKRALEPFKLVGHRYERKMVISALSWGGVLAGNNSGSDSGSNSDKDGWIQEINARGIRHGLLSYHSKGHSEGQSKGQNKGHSIDLQPLFNQLQTLESKFGGRKTITEIAREHLAFLSDIKEEQWVVSFFEEFWRGFASDLKRVGQDTKKAPTYYWLERIQARLRDTSPPIEKLKNSTGAIIERLSQAPLCKMKHTYVLGLPASWLHSERVGDDWFSEQERQTLASEFSVRSAIQSYQEKLATLKAWLSHSEQVTFMDAHYTPDGRERESILPILNELGLSLKEPTEMGSHQRWRQSYEALRPAQPQTITLPPLAKRELTATTLDRISRCSFQGLALQRWKLRDVRQPDIEFWPDVKGNILHQAVKYLMDKQMSEGEGFSFLDHCSAALDHAWTVARPRWFLGGARLERYLRSRLLLILEAFCEKESEYLKRAQTKPISLEDQRLKLEYPSFSVIGEPDRIDEHPDGLFIIDYKTSGTVPTGTDMLESGYRLQLPFYAIATMVAFKKPVLGIQFIELNRKGTRSSGVFIKQYNGKETGKLTNLRSNSKSLIANNKNINEIWARFEEYLVAHAKDYVEGKYAANPKYKDKDCRLCQASDLCGMRRLQGDAQ